MEQLQQARTRGSAPDSAWGHKARQPGFICVLLAVATLAIFWQVARHDFVNYDDPDYVTANLRVQDGLKWESIIWAFKSGHASNWHPLTWLSHMLDCQLFGQNAAAHHLVNVAFHIVNTLLLFLVLRRMTGAHWRSAFVAALFALHPLHVESVAWISERKDVLSTLFFLLTLWAYTRYAVGEKARFVELESPKLKPEHRTASTGRAKERNKKEEAGDHGAQNVNGGVQDETRRWLYYGLALAFFALGLMSKPMLVTVPFLLLLLDYWPLGRLQFVWPGMAAKDYLRLIAEKIPFFALSFASSVITFLVQREGGAVSSALSLWDRVANAWVAYVRYLGKMFWPIDLAVLYPHPGQWPVWQVVACACLLAAITAAVILLVRRLPYLGVGWFWFLGTMVPVIGLVQVGLQSMADRYTYMPMIGLFVMLAWGVDGVFSEGTGRKRVLAVIGVLAVVACMGLTARQLQFWRNSETLFQRAVEVTPKNYLAYNNLGFFYSSKGELDKAVDYYRKSIDINPAYEDALNNLGHALAGQRQFLEAIGYYEAALRVRPNHVEVHNNLGNALSEIGKLHEAMAHYQFALQQKPDHAEAHNNLGIALAMQGKLEEAVDHFQKAIRFKPKYANAHSNLGNALAGQRKLEEAIVQYRECLRLDPKDAQAYNNLANVLFEKGQADESISYYKEAIRLNPKNHETFCNLGVALARLGQREEALLQFSEAVRLRPDYERARRQIQLLEAAKK
ncbi:MAG TPA: tetratricopeptide repeat protein [Clostridia bacterium]|nr:tetratricopeptide repeat protein [Clostridia bacterium]